MSSFLYYLSTAGESMLSVFGIRAPYEQPPYQVIGHLPGGAEIRAYGPRVAVAARVQQDNEGEAFGHLFRYITGANQGGHRIAMTVPVQMTQPGTPAPGQNIAMTLPVQTGGAEMRFFLPASVAAAGPPAPTDNAVHIEKLPPAEFAVLRFSGSLTLHARTRAQDRLLAQVAAAGRHSVGAPFILSYDPPFAIPFLRRNEAAVQLDDDAGPAHAH